MKKILLILSALTLTVCLTVGICVPAVAAPESYKNYVSVATQGSGLTIEPTLVLEPETEDQLDNKGFASVIVTPDAEMNVELGQKRSLKDLFDQKLKGKYIPVLRLTAETAEPFLSWWKGTYTISDIMVLSKDISVLQKIYADEKGYLINTVYDLTDTQLTADRYAQWDNIAAANKAGCNILLYDVQENLPVAAEYVSAMSKVCWARAEDKEEGALAIAAGCYGVVAADRDTLKDSLGYFTEKGFARAQYIAAHRGITKYANEQSLTGIMASYNEGATHVEIDIQITSDGRIISCHNSDIAYVSGIGGKYIINETFANLRKIQLNNFSARYEETFASLEEICEVLQKTDVILIAELKLDGGSAKAVDDLKAIEKLKEVMDKYPGMKGHWITITFYAPYAQEMRRHLPEIPCCYLGGGQSGKESAENVKAWNYAGGHVNSSQVGAKIDFLRKCGIGLDEMEFDSGTMKLSGATNSLAQTYLARGYTMNTWTYEDLSHFAIKTNIATTNKAEDCALLVKEVAVGVTSVTEAELSAGKATVPCRTYNGWSQNCECKVIEVSRSGNTAQVLFYYLQKTGDKSVPEYGIYSQLTTVTVA